MRAIDMSPEQRKAALAEIKRAAEPKVKPMPPLDKLASKKERDDWLREYIRRTA